ncbi:NAD(P)-binding oxidoreductase [Marinicrinis sediminis]|uniref:NAD(P)-binding oxidoreductase n=1 Tax=Marinicrinis sediminis TaxID=1652465 RepID=A0ABW5R9R5_9BACL
MKVVVLGASGATGQHVVRELINRSIPTRILIRETAVLDPSLEKREHLEIVKGNMSELDPSELKSLLQDCTVVISCLGHTPTFKGMFGKPRKLVSDAIQKVCETAIRSEQHIKLILMSTTGYTNRAIGELPSLGQRMVLSALTYLLPPHRDNVMAADYLVEHVGEENEYVQWVVVRPDTLINEDQVSAYELTSSPVRNPLFNPGKTSRINVGHFMTELATDPALWKRWDCKTPVIYNELDVDG